MIVNGLLTLLWLSGAIYVFAMLRAARAQGQLSPNVESIGLGAVTNFFDTLGIGSFAPTTAYLKLRKMVPDSFIPSTLNAGHCIPTIVEALVFIKLVSVDPILLIACIVAATIGAFFGSAAVIRLYRFRRAAAAADRDGIPRPAGGDVRRSGLRAASASTCLLLAAAAARIRRPAAAAAAARAFLSSHSAGESDPRIRQAAPDRDPTRGGARRSGGAADDAGSASRCSAVARDAGYLRRVDGDAGG